MHNLSPGRICQRGISSATDQSPLFLRKLLRGSGRNHPPVLRFGGRVSKVFLLTLTLILIFLPGGCHGPLRFQKKMDRLSAPPKKNSSIHKEGIMTPTDPDSSPKTTGDKPRLLILAQLPPPTHGVTVMSQAVCDSGVLKEKFNIFVLPIRFAASIQEFGRNNVRKLLRLLLLAAQLVYRCLTFKPDLVYFTLVPTGMPFYRDFMLLTLIKWLGIRPVLHLHGLGIQAASSRWIHRFLYRRAFHGVDVIHLSPLLFYDIEEYVPLARTYFLANGIPWKHIKPELSADRPPQADSIRFLFFSNITEEKGPLDFIKALGILKSKGIQFRGIVAGAIASQECFNEITILIKQFNLDTIVKYVGPKFGSDKDALFASADVFVFPTHRDSFPVVLLEAMAHALPIIASAEGAIPAIVDDGITGIVFPKKNMEKLVVALELFTKDKVLCRDMGRSGRDRFLERFKIETFENNLSDIFATCLQQSGTQKSRP